MTLGRIVTAAATWFVALAVALAVPVTQLRTVSIVKECCCPDPDNCHCPPVKPDPGGQSRMHDCHETQKVLVSPQLPSFSAPAIALADTARATSIVPSALVPDPHAEPAAPPPYGPS